MTRQRNLLLSLLLPLLLSAATHAAPAAQQDQNEQLFEAARKGDAATVKALLDRGVDVNAKFRYGATALSYASDKGHLEVVKLLLERKAEVNVKDTFYGATPLIWAAQKGHAKIVEALLASGAEGRDDALQIGASEGQLELVKVVLAAGKLNAEALTGALSAATRAKHTEIAELLTKAGAVPPPAADFQVDAETLKTYVGTYKPPVGGDFTVALKDGKLVAGPASQPLTLGAFDKTRFRPMDIDGVTITFNVENNVVTGFTLKQGTNTQVFKKIQ
ncbi:MAG TPA: ankyrin repeat domain-containing protein [Pyrinomonadaceae bacterium]|nr:ankyrin repeat domain-containing protein [Pyrinomonadaceae bacterium]